MNISTRETSARNSARLYALDALRAVMMLLGPVIHATVTYAPYDSPVRTVMAKNTSPLFYIIAEFIHSFRMHIFFMVAGFFGALLFYRKGAREMMINRITRVLLPLIAGVLVLYPAVFFAFRFSSMRIAGEPNAFANAVQAITSGEFLPYRLSHLWFLYDLMIFSVLTLFPAMIFKRLHFSPDKGGKISILLSQPVLRIAIVALLYFGGLVMNKEYSLHTSVTFWIDKKLLFCYFIFYCAGWLIYYFDVIQSLKWNPYLQILLGLCIFSCSIYLELGYHGDHQLLLLQVSNALATTFLTFGITSYFLNTFNTHSATFAYIMDAAYFVYLVHAPIAIFMPGLLANLGLPLVIEFLVTFITTVGLSFLSYHYLVRGKFIGKFLDGTLFRPARQRSAVTAPNPGPLT